MATAGDVVTAMLERQANLLSQSGRALVMEGDMVVEETDGFTAITTPFLTVREEGQRWVIGMLAINAVPFGDGNWRLAIALPTPIRLMAEGAQEIAKIELSDQKTDILVSGITGDVISATGRFGPIGVTSIVNGLIASISDADVIRGDEGRILTRLRGVQAEMIDADGVRTPLFSAGRLQSSHDATDNGFIRRDEWADLDVNWRGFSFGLLAIKADSIYQNANRSLTVKATGQGLQTKRGEVEAPLSLSLALEPVTLGEQPMDMLMQADRVVIEDSVIDLPDIGLTVDADLTRKGEGGGIIPYHGRADMRIAGAQALGAQAVDHKGLSFILGFLPMIGLIGTNGGVDDFGRPVTKLSFRSSPETGISANGQNIETLLSVIMEGGANGNTDRTGAE